ncbi:lysine N(6)-hydroxylase/L-ornithine N(5)-oxygenase family protein [Pontivivens ytuae]|uniref:SidA/IucD/PvdA family monooxygenase n=1 Tax=Pontivivens ytuae TaxID=2789856 RepID=A0A7S9LUU9_9RHOB|nr:SidA/IucD/PvdA family monooxygenase [Pontivivens ytuae]QPH55601.1 SidA/IucD/PvdA family monooxygenase [Pontivivens ytuae]
MSRISISTHLAGIGIGPFNLSVAALADHVTGLDTLFLERKPAFDWHPGLSLSSSVMQTSFLKDLVTPVLPTSRWSFLNFLVSKDRFYDFMAGRFGTVTRLEFTEYMAWVASRLQHCHFACPVEDVQMVEGGFVLQKADGTHVKAKALSIGTGPRKYVPDFAPDTPDCFHGIDYLQKMPQARGKRVVVVGGGQTGAEIVLDLLTRHDAPRQLTWMSRRNAFWHLQEGSLVDQIFTPGYAEAYRALPNHVQTQAVAEQKYSSDGLTPETANDVYSALYRQRHLENGMDVSLRPARTVTAIDKRFGSFQVVADGPDDQQEACEADIVVLATGFRPAVPECLGSLRDRLSIEPTGALSLGPAYRVAWDGPMETPIYALNHGRHSHGIVDPQLSLTAWRSAVILEDLTGRPIFDALRRPQPGLVDWLPRLEAGEVRRHA